MKYCNKKFRQICQIFLKNLKKKFPFQPLKAGA